MSRLGRERRLTWRLPIVPVLALIVVAASADWLVAQPGGGPKAEKRGPPKSPEEFFEREKTKLAEKRERDGERFDAAREIGKLQEKYQKDFGEALSESRLRDFLATAEGSKASPSDRSSNSSSSRSATRRTYPGPLRREPRYSDGLPEWFAERDRDRDGQIGMYEWPRTEFLEFAGWDLNHDGLVEQTEALRRLRQLALANSGTKPSSLMSTRSTSASRAARTNGPADSHNLSTARPDESKAKAKAKAPPGGPPKPTTPAEFMAKEAKKIAEKAAREGSRFDLDREFQKLRDKYRKDLGDDLPSDIEDELRLAVRRAQDDAARKEP